MRTRGGALAMRSLADGEVMHPGVGPLVEAEQLYVRQSRLCERLVAGEGGEIGRLVLFDVGLGAGSNALAARSASEGLPEGAARLELVSFERELGALELALSAGEPFGWRARRPRPRGPCWPTIRTRPRGRTGGSSAAISWTTLAQQTARADVVYWDPVLAAREPGPLDGGGVLGSPAGRRPPLRALHLQRLDRDAPGAAAGRLGGRRRRRHRRQGADDRGRGRGRATWRGRSTAVGWPGCRAPMFPCRRTRPPTRSRARNWPHSFASATVVSSIFGAVGSAVSVSLNGGHAIAARCAFAFATL